MSSKRDKFLESNFGIPLPKHYRGYKVANIGRKATSLCKLLCLAFVWLIFFAVYVVIWVIEPDLVTNEVLKETIGMPDFIMCWDNIDLVKVSDDDYQSPYWTSSEESQNELFGEDVTKHPITLVEIEGGNDNLRCGDVLVSGEKVVGVFFTWNNAYVYGEPRPFIRLYNRDALEEYADGWFGDVSVTVQKTSYVGGEDDGKDEYSFKFDSAQCPREGDVAVPNTPRMAYFQSAKVHYKITSKKRNFLTVFSQSSAMVGYFAIVFSLIKLIFDTFACNFKWISKVVGPKEEKEEEKEEKNDKEEKKEGEGEEEVVEEEKDGDVEMKKMGQSSSEESEEEKEDSDNKV